MFNSLYKLLFSAVLFISTFETSVFAVLHDFNNLKTSYVMETKKITIPEYPDAFNPCIVRWKDKILMSFRVRDPNTASTDQIGLVLLTNDFELAGPATILERFNETITTRFYMPSYAQDPRLITLNDELYIIYSNIYPTHSGQAVRRMVIGKVNYDSHGFNLVHPHPLLSIEGFELDKKEKNWVPFIFENNLLLAYSISPHRVVQPLDLENTCVPFSLCQKSITWDWGTIRGGTPALKVGDCYLSFFHSLKGMTTVQSDKENMTHYFMGAYTFDAKPPFTIKSMSKKPIVAKTFYEGPMYHNWKPLRAIYPMGFVFDDQFIWVSYGRQDHEMWVVKLDRKELLKSLKPVE